MLNIQPDRYKHARLHAQLLYAHKLNDTTAGMFLSQGGVTVCDSVCKLAFL